MKKDFIKEYLVKELNQKIKMISSFETPDLYCKVMFPGYKHPKKTLDFVKIKNKNFVITIILSERGLGKTFNAKEFMLDEFVNHQRKSAWVLNTATVWKEMWNEFLTLNEQTYPDRWAYTEVTRKGVVYTDPQTNAKTLFIRFLALSQADNYKSNRQDVCYIAWDEINTSLRVVKHEMSRLINVIDKTYYNIKEGKPAQQFWFCNQKSLSLEIFKRMNIDFTVIKYCFTQWKTEDGRGLYCLLSPKKDLAELQAEAEGTVRSKWLTITSVLGQVGDTYLNENSFDINWGIISKHKMKIRNWRNNGEILKIKDTFLNLYMNNKSEWLLRELDKIPEDKSKVYYFRLVDKEMGCVYNKFIKDEIISRINTNKIWFDSINSKLTVFEAIR